MRIITLKRLSDFAKSHPQAKQALSAFMRIIKSVQWKNLHEVRQTFPHADIVKVKSGRNVTVFNVMGNNIRVITAIHYNRQRMYILFVLTHVEYDTNKWKDVL